MDYLGMCRIGTQNPANTAQTQMGKARKRSDEMNGDKKQVSLYYGRCPRCKRDWVASLEVIKSNNVGVVPPPTVVVACQCSIPVTAVPLIYSSL